MCAIDALGVSPMLDQPVEMVSRDPVGRGDVWLRLDPGDGAWWEPTEAVVLAASAHDGPSFKGCCQVLNFFSSATTAERYLVENPPVSGHPISIPEAIEIGRLIFGNILRENQMPTPIDRDKSNLCSPKVPSFSRCSPRPSMQTSTCPVRSTFHSSNLAKKRLGSSTRVGR